MNGNTTAGAAPAMIASRIARASSRHACVGPVHFAGTVAVAGQIDDHRAKAETVAARVGWAFFEPQSAEIAQQPAEHIGVWLDLELDRQRPRLPARRQVLKKGYRIAGALRFAGKAYAPGVEPAAEVERCRRQAEQPGEKRGGLQLCEIATCLVVGI